MSLWVRGLTLVLVVCGVSVAAAGEPWLRGKGHEAMHAAGSTGLVVKPLPPSSHFERPIAQKHAEACGVEVPRYEWGSFGARYRYRHGAHFTYYNDFVKWCFK